MQTGTRLPKAKRMDPEGKTRAWCPQDDAYTDPGRWRASGLPQMAPDVNRALA